MKWIEIDSKRIKNIVKSVKGITLESLSKEMGHGRGFLSDACGRGRMNATDLKLLSMLLNVPQAELEMKELEPEPVHEVQNITLQAIFNKLDALETKIDALTKAVNGIKPYPTKPPKTEGQKLAERILVRTMAGSRYCRYDTYIANCELQGIEAIDTTKAWKSCHCELKKKGYGVNQSNWLVVLDGYELPNID